ncbi:Holliday junction resolvase, partial [Pseudomonas aeruginosa]
MRYRFSLLFCCLLAPAAHAFDTTTAFTAKSLYVTSKLTSTPFENKLLRDARGDAASFVAS